LINQRVLDTSLKVFMRFRVAGSSQDVIRVLERIEYVARALNIEVNGTSIVLTVKRGFLSRGVEMVPITYAIVYRGSEVLITFFVAMDRKPVLRARVGGVGDTVVIETTCLGEKPVCREIEKLLQSIAKMRYANTESDVQPTHRFSINDKYTAIIDGLAEVTLTTLYLRYPLLDRYVVRLEDVKDIDEFLERLYRVYSPKAREIIACIEAENWRLILAIDFNMKTYTPSFIENSTRVVGLQAIEKLRSKHDDRAILTIFAMKS